MLLNRNSEEIHYWIKWKRGNAKYLGEIVQCSALPKQNIRVVVGEGKKHNPYLFPQFE